MKMSISVPDILIDAAHQKAGKDKTLSNVVRLALEAYVGKRAVRHLVYELVDP